MFILYTGTASPHLGVWAPHIPGYRCGCEYVTYVAEAHDATTAAITGTRYAVSGSDIQADPHASPSASSLHGARLSPLTSPDGAM